MKKTIAFVLLGIIIGVLGFFGIRYQIKQNRYEAEQNRILNEAYMNALRAVDFISLYFPDQVTDYIKKINELEAARTAK